jgi:hypothetical protein
MCHRFTDYTGTMTALASSCRRICPVLGGAHCWLVVVMANSSATGPGADQATAVLFSLAELQAIGSLLGSTEVSIPVLFSNFWLRREHGLWGGMASAVLAFVLLPKTLSSHERVMHSASNEAAVGAGAYAIATPKYHMQRPKDYSNWGSAGMNPVRQWCEGGEATVADCLLAMPPQEDDLVLLRKKDALALVAALLAVGMEVTLENCDIGQRGRPNVHGFFHLAPTVGCIPRDRVSLSASGEVDITCD